MSDPNPLIQDLRHHTSPDDLVIVSNSLLIDAAKAIEEAEARAEKAEAELKKLQVEIRRTMNNLSLSLQIPSNAMIK